MRPCGRGAAAVAAACVVTWVGLAAPALAQAAMPSADPLAPASRDALKVTPAFKPAGKAPLGPSTRGFTPVPSGAGRTGFDSTNARKKNAASRASTKSTATSKGKPATTPATDALASGSAATAPRATAEPSPYQKPIPPLAEQAMAARVPVTPVGAQPAPLTKRKKLAAEGDPYEPLGLRLGTFDVFPAIEAYGGYDSNPGARSSGSGSALVTIAPELRAQSNWLRHELKADLRGSYNWYRDDLTPSISRPQATGSVDGRIDVTRDTRIDLGGRLLIGTDYPNSPNVQAGLSRLPISTTFGGVAGIAHRFNRLEVGVKGTVDRTVWQKSSLVDGTTADNNDRDLNQYGGTLRAGYELRPGVTPYVEGGYDTRVHDLTTDYFGYQRDSKAWLGRVGTTFELSRLLTGDVSIGYTKRTYQDTRLPDVKGLLFDASLLWTATSLTNVKLTGKTSVGESTVPGISGVLYRDVGLQVDHALRRWLIATVKFGFGFDLYQGSAAAFAIDSDREDQRYSLGFGLTYKLSRELWLKGEVRREWLRTNVTGYNYDANVFLLGLRLQK